MTYLESAEGPVRVERGERKKVVENEDVIQRTKAPLPKTTPRRALALLRAAVVETSKQGPALNDNSIYPQSLALAKSEACSKLAKCLLKFCQILLSPLLSAPAAILLSYERRSLAKPILKSC